MTVEYCQNIYENECWNELQVTLIMFTTYRSKPPRLK